MSKKWQKKGKINIIFIMNNKINLEQFISILNVIDNIRLVGKICGNDLHYKKFYLC